MNLHVWSYPLASYIIILCCIKFRSGVIFEPRRGRNLAIRITLAIDFYNCLYNAVSSDCTNEWIDKRCVVRVGTSSDEAETSRRNKMFHRNTERKWQRSAWSYSQRFINGKQRVAGIPSTSTFFTRLWMSAKRHSVLVLDMCTGTKRALQQDDDDGEGMLSRHSVGFLVSK